MNGRARRALLGGLLVAVLGACQLQLDVKVLVEGDGSGTIVVDAALDDDAVQRLGGDLAAIVDLDGLRADGWTVDGPERDGEGMTRLHLERRFDDPDGATAALAELSGQSGPFRDLTVERDKAWNRTRWRFTGDLDLSRGAGEGPVDLDDAQLKALQRQLGESLSRLVQVRVGVRLPGDVTSNATTKADNGAVWQAAFGGAPIEMEATSTQVRTPWFILLGVLVLALLGTGVVVLIKQAGRSIDRRSG